VVTTFWKYTLDGGEITIRWVSGKGASSMMKNYPRCKIGPEL